nr:G patch domain-containing protein TGH [Ipomoea batatas]
MPEAGKPFRDDPAKQERFEQFLKEKYQGGLRPKDSGGSSTMSEAGRARERLEFEAVAEAIEKGKWGIESKPPNELFSDTLAVAASRFTSSTVENTKVDRDEELAKKKLYPKREEFQWRPSPILCKRFDLIDPYMGKPPPAPRARSKMDSLIFMTDSVKSAKVEESVTDRLFSVSEASQEEIRTQKEIEAEIEVENVERPVDLYKAIFSDDSDDEEIMNRTQAKDPEEKVEAANTTLNRLIAGDFLESLGKELGLEVPPDVTFPETKASTTDKETFNAERPIGNKISSADNARNVEAMLDKPHLQEILQGDRLKSGGTVDFISHRNDSRTVSSGSDMNRNIPQKEIGVMKNPKEKRIDHQGIEVVARGTQSTISIGGAADLLIILGKNVENPEERNTNIKNSGSWFILPECCDQRVTHSPLKVLLAVSALQQQMSPFWVVDCK